MKSFAFSGSTFVGSKGTARSAMRMSTHHSRITAIEATDGWNQYAKYWPPGNQIAIKPAPIELHCGCRFIHAGEY